MLRALLPLPLARAAAGRGCGDDDAPPASAVRRRRHHRAGRGLRARGRRASACDVTGLLRAERRSARVRAPPRRRQGARATPTWSCAPAATSTSGSTDAIDSSGADARGRHARRRTSTLDRRRPALVAGPAQRDRRRGRAARRAGRRRSRRRRDAYRRARRRLHDAARAARPARCAPASTRSRPRERTLVTTHDALGYYARRYGIRVVGAVIPSRSTVAQPSAGEVAQLVETIRREGVHGDLRRELGQRPTSRRRSRATSGARVGQALWADTLGPADSDGATYVDSIASNTAALVDGFSGGAIACRPRPDARPLRPVHPARAARDAAARGARRAARQLDRAAPARVLHPRGRHGRASPALVLASAWGIAPQLAALAAALGFGVAQERLERARRLRRRRGDRPAARRRAGRRRRARLGRVRVRRRGRHAAVRLADRAQRDATSG